MDAASQQTEGCFSSFELRRTQFLLSTSIVDTTVLEINLVFQSACIISIKYNQEPMRWSFHLH